MPYITQAERDFLDPHIEKVVEHVKALVATDKPSVAGLLNYVVTKLLVRTLPEKRYWTLALGIGTLVCCILEFYRRFVGKYEDEAILKNGDLEEYK